MLGGARAWLEPLSVVLDGERDAFAGTDHSNAGPSGSSVAENVGDRFLHHPKADDLHIRGEPGPLRNAGGLEGDGQTRDRRLLF